jgi:hypothetical protein
MLVSLAGCIEGSDPVDIDTGDDLGLLLAGPPLWEDPQNTPHPAFGWATLSSPTDAPEAPWFWKPINATPLPDTIAGITHVARSPDDVRSGAGIALFGRLAIVPGYGAPTAILDISDPTKPVTLSTFNQQEGLGNHRGAVVIPYPDGRLVTVFSTGPGLDVWDITDPTNPTAAATIAVSSHKVGVVPGTPIVYNAASRGGAQVAEGSPGVTEIYDLTDPEEPVEVAQWNNGYSCHHVYFWNSPDGSKQRGICAGSKYAQLWDTADPRDPSVIVSVPLIHGVSGTPSTSQSPATAWAHYAGLNIDGTILMVGDEMGGGSTPPGCLASANTPQGALSLPQGSVYFYDVSNEQDPRLLGWYSPTHDPRIMPVDGTCTAHHGRLVPDPQGRDLLAMSFYHAGVVLIDFTGVGSQSGPLPRAVDQYVDGSDTWETWYYNGYLFTGDLARGLDVLAFE